MIRLLRPFRPAAACAAPLAASGLLFAACQPVPIARPATEYQVAFPNAAHHEAEVRVTFPQVPSGTLELRMSRTSPGRYALHEFAKNVYRVRAVGSDGTELPVDRPNPHQWNVRGHDGTVTVTYTLFADYADGTYPGVDASHAHLNMPATFLWARGLEDRPIRITFHPPEGSGWQVATQLVPGDEPYTFSAPDLAYFMDSPTELADLDVREWRVGEGEGAQTIRLAVHHLGSAEDVDRFARMAERVVAAQIAVFGEAPRFDHGEYTFIADYLPWVYGDGMEHRNSTILTNRTALAGEGARTNLGTLSHEFFHAFSMERLRAAALEPFDFEAENMSDELWFGEGFTSYYDDLTIRRAGLTSLDGYAREIGGAVNAVVNAPGREVRSPVEMSRYAPFVDRASWIDRVNTANTFVSYYTWGSVVALGLDLTLRVRFGGLTLDDYMRALWERYGRSEDPYTMADLRTVLGEVTDDPAFADAFFVDHVEGSEVVDLAPLLERAGLVLRPAAPGRAWIGSARLEGDGDAAVVVGPTLRGSPLYRAGLDLGDRIVSVGGRPPGGAEGLTRTVAAASPGDTLRIEFEKRGRTGAAELVVAEDPRLEIVPFEAVGREVDAGVRAFRAAWLGPEPAGADGEETP